MKKTVIIYNKKNILGLATADTVATFLQDKNIDAFKTEITAFKGIEKDIDTVICIGGDGTILSVGKMLLGTNIPIFGINTGHLGYLTTTEEDNCIDNLSKLFNNEYTIEERVTLNVTTDNGNFDCINEAVFHRGTKPHLLNTTIEINGQDIDSIRGDGILIATPTGSTAYNLSAGGPIISPTAKGMLITPICAHSLTARPIVLAEDDTVTITFNGNETEENKAQFSADGNVHGETAKATIKLGNKKLLLIKTEEKNFYKILRKKLSVK